MSTVKQFSVRRPLAIAMAGGLGLVLVTTAACGSDSSEGADGVRTIEIATAAESKPLAWGAVGHEPQGYEPEVLKAVDELLPEYEFAMEGAADIAQETGLATGKYDMIAGGFYKTPERSDQFLIPETAHGASLMTIYTRADSDISGMEDLEGKKIVPVSAGGGVFKFTTDWQEKNPDVKLDIQTASSGIPYPDRLKQVESGKYDALILPSNLGEQTVIDEQGLAIKASEPVDVNNTYFLIHDSEENQALVEAVDKALQTLREDGTLAELSTKWFGDDHTQYIE